MSSKCREELPDDVTDAEDALLPAVAVEVVGGVVAVSYTHLTLPTIYSV